MGIIEGKINYLNLVTDVDDKGIRDVLNIIPKAIPANLEARHIIRDKDGEQTHVCMSRDTKSQIRARTWWVVIDLQEVHNFLPTTSLLYCVLNQP